MPSTQHLEPYCLIISEHTVDVTRLFQLKRGFAPTHLVFRMPDVPQRFFQLPTLTRWYTKRLGELQCYAKETQQRFSRTHLTVDVMCGTRQQVLRELAEKQPCIAHRPRAQCAQSTAIHTIT